MILDDILPQRNDQGRLLSTTRTVTVAELCTIPSQSLMITLQPSEIDDVASSIKSYASSMKELLDLYKSEEVVKTIRKYDKDLRVSVD